MQKELRRQKQIAEIDKQLDLLYEKKSVLATALELETDPEKKFKLEHEIKDITHEIQSLEFERNKKAHEYTKLFVQGEDYTEESKYEQAIQCFVRAYFSLPLFIELFGSEQEKREEVNRILGYICTNAGNMYVITTGSEKVTTAIEAYLKALDIDNAYLPAIWAIAEIYFHENKYENASQEYIDCYVKAKRVKDNEYVQKVVDKIYKIKDWHLKDKDGYEKATKLLLDFYDADPETNGDTLDEIFEIADWLLKDSEEEYLHQGEEHPNAIKKAIRIYKKLLNVERSVHVAQAFRKLLESVELYSGEGDYSNAIALTKKIRDWTRGLADQSYYQDASLKFAELYGQSGDPNMAIKTYQELLVPYQTGLEDYSEGEENFRLKAVEIYPKVIEVYRKTFKKLEIFQ
jgi:tetratricopeptide (TPR) repeat protein